MVRRRTTGTLFITLLTLMTGCDGWPSGTAKKDADAPEKPAPTTDDPKPTASRPPKSDEAKTTTAATPATLFRYIPADAMLVVHARPLPRHLNPDAGGDWEKQATSQPTRSPVDALVRVFTKAIESELKPRDLIGLRIGEAFVAALNYPYAIAMIDVGARPLPNRPEASRMERLRLAAIVDAGADKVKFIRIIQKVVIDTTHDKFATITKRKAGGIEYAELYDSRLPEHDVVTWGEIDDKFVIAFGRGTFDALVNATNEAIPSLQSEGWVPRVRAERAADTYFEMIVNSQSIRTKLDRDVRGAASDFFEAWESENVQRSHWAFGMTGRAMSSVAHFESDGETTERVFARPLSADSETLKLIPADTNYAMYEVDMGRFLRRLVLGLVATRDPKVKAEIRQAWSKMQQAYDFDAQTEYLDQLGDTAIMHKYPMHPIKLPFAVTTLIEIDGDPKLVAQSLNRMCIAWEELQAAEVEKGIVAPAKLLKQRGTWFLSFGFLGGPAWIVTEKYVVFSWSANALHQYLDTVGDEIGKIVPFPTDDE